MVAHASELWNQRLVRLRPTLLSRAVRLAGGGGARPGVPLPEDLAQEVLTRLLAVVARESAGEVPSGRRPLVTLDDEALRRYALQTLTHLYFDACRRKREAPWPEFEGAPLIPAAPGTGEKQTLAALDRARALPRAMQTCLDAPEQRFLRAVFEHGSASDAQRQCGWPPGSASNAGHKLDQIRRRLLTWLTGPAEGSP